MTRRNGDSGLHCNTMIHIIVASAGIAKRVKGFAGLQAWTAPFLVFVLMGLTQLLIALAEVSELDFYYMLFQVVKRNWVN